MLSLAIISYLIMCWITNWDILWPLTMLTKGGLGDWLIVGIWVIILLAGLDVF